MGIGKHVWDLQQRSPRLGWPRMGGVARRESGVIGWGAHSAVDAQEDSRGVLLFGRQDFWIPTPHMGRKLDGRQQTQTTLPGKKLWGAALPGCSGASVRGSRAARPRARGRGSKAASGLRGPGGRVRGPRAEEEGGRKRGGGWQGKREAGGKRAGRRRGAGRGGAAGDAPRAQAVWPFSPSVRSGFPLPSRARGERERGRFSAPTAAGMWPPDQDPDPEPAGRPRPGAAVPGLRALLPARAFLCSLKGRLLLAESVSAARAAPAPTPARPGPLPPPGRGAGVGPRGRRPPSERPARPTSRRAARSWAKLGRFPRVSTGSARQSEARRGAELEA